MGSRSTHSASSRTHSILWLSLVIFVGLNLRPFLTGIGPLVHDIVDATGLSFKNIAWLTLLPMACMGVFAFVTPSVRRHLSSRHTMLFALGLLLSGSALRLFVPNGFSLILTAALCGIGVALLQALLPAIIKQHFPFHVAPVTGLYSAMLMMGGAMGAQITPWVAAATESWRFSLAFWALPVLAAVFIGWYVLPKDAPNRSAKFPSDILMRRPRTWLLIVCFGLINSSYTSIVAWLAPFYQEQGWSASASGSLIAVLSIAQAIAALSIPTLARNHVDRRPWLWFSLSLQALGFASYAFWPSAAPYFWSSVIGVGLGGCFALTLVVALDHFDDPVQAGVLSALMQGGGFLIAAIAPWTSALIRDVSGGFTNAWILHLGLVGVIAVLVWRFSPKHYQKVMAPLELKTAATTHKQA